MATETTRKSRVAGDIPSDQKEAIKWIAHSRSTPEHSCSIAMLVREAIDTYLRVYPQMPETAREQLPDDFDQQNPVFTPDGDIDIDAITGDSVEVGKDEPTEETEA